MRSLVGATALLVLMAVPSALSLCRADTVYQQTNLVSDIQGLAQVTDPSLVNPWGVSFSGTSPFWVSDTGKNLATLYVVNASGVSKNALEVAVPTTGSGPQGPTGQVFNSTASDFVIPADNAKASFIFSNLNGTISAWNGGLTPNTQAVVVATTTGGNYTGLALGGNASGSLLYAANNAAGKIDVFNGSFAPVSLGANAFANPAGLPAGLVPFNVQNINGNIYVTYAPAGHAAQTSAAQGQGAVAEFDSSGNFKAGSLIVGGKLAAPWGVTVAPASFGTFGGDLLVGNFSYAFSEINAYDPVTGAFRGTLSDANGNPIINQGLWAINFGNGGNGGDVNTLYFGAGIMGETHGLFGAIAPAAAPVPEPSTIVLLLTGGLVLQGIGCWRKRRA
ncbi:MAG TPA: TIGR03118 family protein [Gemmataceae bacterium]|nr:TIGR03118 family protein [Gemmataceae bacterium]